MKLNIMLACAAGMSTSILVSKMIGAAKEQNLDVHIFALPTNEAIPLLGANDICLLGPQVKFELSRFVKAAKDTKCKVAVIDMRHYGQANGKAVLEQALKMYHESI